MWHMISRLFGASKEAEVFDAETASKIMQMHEQHPNLGHRGLHRVLEDGGVHVSQADLKRFLKARGLQVEGKDRTPPPSSTFPPVA